MKKIIIWLFILAALGLLAVYAYIKMTAGHKDPLKSSDIIKIESSRLYKEFNESEDSANKKYLGKTNRRTFYCEGCQIKY